MRLPLNVYDYSTEEGAERLRSMIEGYWDERGMAVTLTVHCFISERKGFVKYAYVLSNMRNGWPVSVKNFQKKEYGDK